MPLLRAVCVAYASGGVQAWWMPHTLTYRKLSSVQLNGAPPERAAPPHVCRQAVGLPHRHSDCAGLMVCAGGGHSPRPHSSNPGGHGGSAALQTNGAPDSGSCARLSDERPLLHRNSPGNGATAFAHASSNSAGDSWPHTRHSPASLEAGGAADASPRRGQSIGKWQAWRRRLGGAGLVSLGVSVICTTLYTTILKHM